MQFYVPILYPGSVQVFVQSNDSPSQRMRQPVFKLALIFKDK